VDAIPKKPSITLQCDLSLQLFCTSMDPMYENDGIMKGYGEWNVTRRHLEYVIEYDLSNNDRGLRNGNDLCQFEVKWNISEKGAPPSLVYERQLSTFFKVTNDPQPMTRKLDSELELDQLKEFVLGPSEKFSKKNDHSMSFWFFAFIGVFCCTWILAKTLRVKVIGVVIQKIISCSPSRR